MSQNDRDDGKKTELPAAKPKINVVDRRFWQRSDDDDEDEGPTKPTYVATLEAKLADAEGQVQAIRDQYREAKGELEAARARMRRELRQELEGAKRSMLAELVGVVDNLDRAIESAAETHDPEALRHGVELVRSQFLATLEGLGVRRQNSLGQAFDPSHHEAISTVPVDEPERDNKIVGVVKESYLIGEDVLRPGQVAVGKLRNAE